LRDDEPKTLPRRPTTANASELVVGIRSEEIPFDPIDVDERVIDEGRAILIGTRFGDDERLFDVGQFV